MSRIRARIIKRMIKEKAYDDTEALAIVVFVIALFIVPLLNGTENWIEIIITCVIVTPIIVIPFYFWRISKYSKIVPEEYRRAEEQRKRLEDELRKKNRERAEEEKRKQKEFEAKTRTLNGLINLTSSEFEQLIQSLFEKDYPDRKVQLTKAGADEGVDIIIKGNGLEVAQCKKYSTKRKIGAKDLRDFYGAMKDKKARRGYFVTTTSFSKFAIDFAEGKNIVLIDGTELIAWIKRCRGSDKSY